ncbi:MAG: hypothetical protein WDO73_15670 [Ignavibacteriota bacterium]
MSTPDAARRLLSTAPGLIAASASRDTASRSACAALFRLALPFLLFALSAPAATFYLTISGLGGEPDYDQRFKGLG